MNKTFATFRRALNKERYLESVSGHFLLMPSYRRFPNDEEFKREIKVRDLYNFRSRSYWLRKLENHNRQERVAVDEYTIEHILPQNEALNAKWREDLGDNWEQVQSAYLHTLGNLTLTGYNSEYGDRPFLAKRDMEGGFKDSPLKLNKGLGQLEKWDATAIQSRADRLAEEATKVWACPAVDEATLATYRPAKKQPSSSFTIDDHPYLAEGSDMYGNKVRELFEELRKRILALDPCVSEEFLKKYVAYKAETNFVDIVPQAKRLRLSLNMAFPEINDPEGICKDVTGRGRWGNGDVEIGLERPEDIPYVMGLIRQSFERQMGNDS
jgi:predicted transport protein